MADEVVATVSPGFVRVRPSIDRRQVDALPGCDIYDVDVEVDDEIANALYPTVQHDVDTDLASVIANAVLALKTPTARTSKAAIDF